MRNRFIILALFACSTSAQAASTFRVGNQVLSAGDSAARVQELLGRPSYKSRGGRAHGSRKKGRKHSSTMRDSVAQGEQWQYRRGDHTTTVTIVDGKVVDIEDRRG